MHRLLMLMLGAIVGADLAQPLFLPWEPRFVAAIAGALLYTAAAAAMLRGHAAGLWLVLCMPVVPLGTIALWAAGVEVPVEPGAAMVGIAAIQVVAAALAGRLFLAPAT